MVSTLAKLRKKQRISYPWNWPLKTEFFWHPVAKCYFLLGSVRQHMFVLVWAGIELMFFAVVWAGSSSTPSVPMFGKKPKNLFVRHTQSSLLPSTPLLWELHCNASLTPSPTPPLKASPEINAILPLARSFSTLDIFGKPWDSLITSEYSLINTEEEKDNLTHRACL